MASTARRKILLAPRSCPFSYANHPPRYFAHILLMAQYRSSAVAEWLWSLNDQQLFKSFGGKDGPEIKSPVSHSETSQID